MASPLVLAYSQSALPSSPSSTQFPPFFNSARPSFSDSSFGRDNPGYQSTKSGVLSPNVIEHRQPAVIAAQAAGGRGRSDWPAEGLGRDSQHGSFALKTSQPTSSIASAEVTSPSSKTSAARDRFKINLKKITQQKENANSPMIDLSKTADENERQSGIGILSQRSASRSATDLYSTSLPQGRSPAFASDAEYGSYRPSPPFAMPIRQGNSRPQSPLVSNRSYSNSIVSDYGSTQGIGERPNLRVNTSPDLSSMPFPGHPRRNTNQSINSLSAVTPTGSKPRKSLDRAINRIGRRDSSATATSDIMLDEMTRIASIQAARQAFDKHQEEKDAKYERRAAKDREREARRQARRRSTTSTRTETPTGRASPASRAGRSRRGTLSSLREKEKTPVSVEGVEYSELPVAATGSRARTADTRAKKQRVSMSRTKALKNQHAWFLSWWKTKLLNLKRTAV